MLYLALLVLSIAVVIAKYYRHDSRYPRGPGVLEIFASFVTNRVWIFRELSRKYGALYTIWIGSRPVVVVSSNQLAQEIFADKKKISQVLWDSYITDTFFGRDIRTILWSHGNESWEQLRRLFSLSIGRYMNSQHTYDITDQVMDETFINIAARAKDKDFDISDYTTFMSCNLISGWVFGKTMPFDSEYYKEAILVNERTHMCLGLLSAGCLIRQIRYLFRLFGIEKLVFANMNRVQKESLKKLIDTESCPDDKKPIARHLLDTRNDLRNSQPDTRWRHMTEDNIAASLVENTFASSQVSELFFKWMILYLAKNHDIQIRLRQEIVSLDDSTFMGNSQKYIYTQAFIAELLRLRTTTSINTGHVLSQDMEISGYQVRKGTLIALDVHSINCDPIFGPAPESFNPDRFIDNGYFDKMKYSKIAHFGLGARSCPAKELVRHQYCAALVRMLKITKGQFFVMSPDFESTVDDADPRKWVLVCPKKYHMRIVADNNNYVC